MSVLTAGFLAAGLLGGPVAAAAAWAPDAPTAEDPIRVEPVTPSGTATRGHAASDTSWKVPDVIWPAEGSAEQSLGGPVGKAPGQPSVLLRSGKAVGPVSPAASDTSGVRVSKGHARSGEKARVRVLGRDAADRLGVEGVVLSVEPLQKSTGDVQVEVDYDAFRHAYGGDWASRLRLKALPACALTTPEAQECGKATELATVNDTESGKLSAPVTLSAMAGQATVLAATASAAGASGDYSATPLSPSGAWSAGGSSGGFNWSYDLTVPDVPGDVSPKLSIGYSSTSLDGRTAATNNQPSGIGDGWTMEPGYIERQYVSCMDDKAGSNNPTAKVGDLCWKKDNAVLNLNGRTNQLIKDSTTGDWHMQSDDGTTIEKAVSVAGNNFGDNNGDDNGEYWKVTTPDGTQYYFGANRLDGWVSGEYETRSTWTVPVFGNHSGEPCYDASFKDAWCQQAWRWNLDYVVDPHGDVMTYYWGEETNFYGRNVDPSTGASTATEYDRSGYLKRIEYGLRKDTVYTQAPVRVTFNYSQRCVTGCETFDAAHAKNWPDVPFDQYCASGTECKNRYSPSFWTRYKLATIASQDWSGSAWTPVDTWTLDSNFPGTGDGTAPLWLKSITRTGHTGTGDVTLPSVGFNGMSLPNRVVGATTGGKPDPVPALMRYRVTAIHTESGGTIGIGYTPSDCSATSVPSPASNTRRCYPVKWSPPQAPGENYEPYLDWFHAYAVEFVLEEDKTGGAPAKRTGYSYPDGMKWTKAEDDEFTKAEHLTYSDRKGFGRVQVRVGADPFPKTLKEYRYFRGIPGDQVKDSSETPVAVTDHEAFAGMVREEATYNGDGGTLETATSYTPWVSTATATENRAGGLPPRHAYITGGAKESTRTAVGQGWRTTETRRTFDGNGNLLTESRLGDTAKSGDEECSTTTYAPGRILGLPSEIQTVAKPCGSPTMLPADLISTERRYYDGATSLTAVPAKGDVTRLDEQDAAGTGYLTTAKHTYDQHGRELTDTDALGNTTTTAYTPATGVPTSVKVTNALGHATTTTYDPLRGVATSAVDANGKRTDAVHDGLGRVLKVWQPGWPKADHADQPSAQYEYKISKTQANAVTTKTLKQNGEYGVAHTLYDGLLRERQTQTPARGTAHSVLTETRYDTRGWVWKSFAPYYGDVAPSTTLYTAKEEHQVDNVTKNTYDGMGRITTAASLFRGTPQWETKTVYGGDRVTVTPPKGGTVTTKVSDARGRTTQLIQYAGAGQTQPQTTTYAYGKYGEPESITDPAGNTWSYTYDSRGQKTEVDDPDKGLSTLTYDALGRVVTAKDARDTTLTTLYDKLGRKTELKNGTTTLAKWTYDTLAKGLLTSSSRYADGAEYKEQVGGYTDRYQPTASSLTVPTAAGGLAGTYAWKYGYDEKTGALRWTENPAIGSIGGETVFTSYNADDLPYRTTRGGIVLVANVTYDHFSRPVRTEFGDSLDKKVWRTQAYDDHTGRLVERVTDRYLAPQRVDRSLYAYDPAGNVTGITSTTGQDATASTDRQCFANDQLGRLTQAWTAKTDCATAPSTSSVGGPDAYWLTYGYDKLGNRTEEQNKLTGATTAYTPGGSARPHAVERATVTGGPDDGRVSTFQYDATGNTTHRAIGTKTQNLTWDAEGHLATLTEAGKTTSYLYDADGNRLLTKNADGTQVLTLPNGDELRLAANGTTKTATRYYTHAGETVAVHTGSTISYLVGDHQGTALSTIDVSTLAVTHRKQLPFGQLRTSQSAAFGTRGFVGGTNDPTGLTHLGAREYDPTTGRFLSVDPVIDFNDPAQMNAYAYGHNNPLTKSDPTGLRPDGPVGGNGVADYHWAQDRGMTTGYYTQKNGEYIWDQKPRQDPQSQAKYKAYRANPATYRVRSGQHTVSNEVAAAMARKAEKAKIAEAQRRKTEGILGSIAKAGIDLLQGRDNWLGDKVAKIAGAYLAADTIGICGSASFGIGVGGAVEGCLVATTRMDGTTTFGGSFSYGSELPSVGANATVGLMGSNATDFEQLRGDSWGGTVAGGLGPAASIGHQRGEGAFNYRGEPVGSTTVSIGAGYGIEAGFASRHNAMVGHWWTW